MKKSCAKILIRKKLSKMWTLIWKGAEGGGMYDFYFVWNY